ncbi:MAG: nicotinate-nucleotide adenylyltransferase [Lachnospiraceae bacterium]|nr:nicotinate-nucleotide adenylyltransferase [Lachnospiraceae bacterium]
MKQPHKIAMFGGSFNPIHNAHTAVASAFVKKLKLDKIIFIPTATPPHKSDEEMISAEHRLNMCIAAAENVKKSEVSDIEIKRSGKSYTVDTLKQLKQLYPDSELYLITGADMFLTLQDWKCPKEIFSLATVCTVPRNDADCELLREHEERLREMGAKTVVLDLKRMDISSSEVRKRVFYDEDISGLVDSKVEKYIYANYLYMNKSKLCYERFNKVIKARMGEKRYIHSVNVSIEAQRLAKKYGADVSLAKLAGLLHDCTKETSAKQQLQIIENSNIILSDVEKSTQKLWHSIAGAAFVRDVMGIDNEDVFNAIRYHTSGRANMSLLEKVIYIADFTGAERDYDGVDKMRALADRSLEEAMAFGLSFSIADLAQRSLAIDPNTVLCYNEVILQTSRKK